MSLRLAIQELVYSCGKLMSSTLDYTRVGLWLQEVKG
jgi:hypothetical protein